MSEKKQLKLAYGLALACLVVGIVSYSLIQARSPEEPVRVFYECTGDNVLFDHMTHSETYGLECTDCHHKVAWQDGGEGSEEGNDNDMDVSCGSCHTGEGEYEPALGENGMFDHDAHAEYYGLSCTECHHMYDEESDDEPQNCNACHMETGDESMPSLTDSYHQQCIECHVDFGSGPTTENCNDCHQARNRTDAYHDQCAGCHEDMGSGPAEDDCDSCHGY
ncbi:MAG: cytochrome c3 family protein [Desulfosalsimonas sp.]